MTMRRATDKEQWAQALPLPGAIEPVGDGSQGAGNGAQEGRRVPGPLVHGVF